jgi:hypothetical protein
MFKQNRINFPEGAVCMQFSREIFCKDYIFGGGNFMRQKSSMEWFFSGGFSRREEVEFLALIYKRSKIKEKNIYFPVW